MHVVRGTEEYTVAEGHEWFWNQFADGSWEPETFRIFDRFLDKEKVFIDIGAWIGPTTLYAASRAKQVMAFEPDPVAWRSLATNLEFNRAKNVIPFPVAVSNEWKGIDFGAKTGLGDSMSSEIWGHEGGMQVPAVAFSSLIADVKPGFVKIDIEGGEKFLFEGKPFDGFVPDAIHLSLHTPWFADDLEAFKKPIMEALSVYPYIYDQNLNPIMIENAFDVNAFNSIVATFVKL